MIDKNPESYSLLQYGGVLALAIWGGIINYMRRVRAQRIPRFSMVELVGEIATSGFAGILVFWLCEAFMVHPLITAATVGIAGHIGGRTIICLEDWIMLYFHINTSPTIPPPTPEDKDKTGAADG